MEVDDIENSSFLIGMKYKIPHIAYTKWKKAKIRLKQMEKKLVLKESSGFKTNLINIEEKAQYVCKQARPNERSYRPRVITSSK